MANPHSADDIAIIGLGCRFPGDAVSPNAFFEMLLKGRDAWKVTPSERFNVDSFYHPSAGRQGSTVVRAGYYLKEDVALFDAPAKTTEDSQKDLKTLLIAAKSITDTNEVVQSALVQKLAKLVMISEVDIDVFKPVHHYGVDPHVAIDFRNWIFRELKSTITVFDILNSVPLTQLAAKIVRNSGKVPEEYKKEE